VRAASRTSRLAEAVGLSLDDVTLVNTAPSNMATRSRTRTPISIARGSLRQRGLTKVQGSYKVIYGGCQSCYDAGTVVTTKQAIAEKSKALELFILAMRAARTGRAATATTRRRSRRAGSPAWMATR
jgi:hypothetical protein